MKSAAHALYAKLTTLPTASRSPWRTNAPAAASAALALVLPATLSRSLAGGSTRSRHTSGESLQTVPNREQQLGQKLIFL